MGPARTALALYEIELADRLGKVRTAADRAGVLASYLFREQLFSASADLTSPATTYIHRVMEGKQGYCLSLSAVILALGRRLGLPVHGVAAPRHFFVRLEDDTGRVNIETTEGGRIRPDEFYRRRGISRPAEEEGVYLRNLTDAEVVAHLLNNEGYLFWARGDLDRAGERFREAVALHPRLAEAYVNLGVIAGERGDEAAAREHFTRALRWIPGDGPILFNRSLAALRAGRLMEALEDMDRGLCANPGSEDLRHFQALLFARVLEPETWRKHQAAVTAAAREARAAGRLAPGLRGRYFADRTLGREAGVRIDRAIDFEWRWNAPMDGVPSDGFSVRWEGFVEIPSEGIWSFMTVANDGVRVFVDGVRIIDNWKVNEGAVDQEHLRLIPGLHALRVEYFDHERFAGITLAVKQAEASRPLDPSRFHHARNP